MARVCGLTLLKSALGLFIVSLMGGILLMPSALAAAPVTLSVLSDGVSLLPGETSRVVVLISNDTKKQVRIKLRPVVPSESVMVVADRPGKRVDGRGRRVNYVKLAAEASTVVAYDVTFVKAQAAESLTVAFIAKVLGSPRTVASVSLKVSTPAAGDITTAEFKPDLKTLNEYRPAETSLVLTNKRNEQVTLTRLRMRAPRDVTLAVDCSGTELKIADGGQRTLLPCVRLLPARGQAFIHVRVESSGYLAPGQRTIVVEVTARTTSADKASVVATEDFDVEIYAESDLLKALGVPIFLLLPGALATGKVFLGPQFTVDLSPQDVAGQGSALSRAYQSYRGASGGRPARKAIRKLYAALKDTERPLIVAGGSVAECGLHDRSQIHSRSDDLRKLVPV